MKRIIVFAFLWLMVGFSTGTTTLLGPVEWIAAAARTQPWGAGVESTLVRVVIGVFVTVSAVIAALITRVVVRTSQAHVRYGVPAIATLAALAALWLWSTPEIAAGGEADEQTVSSAFTLGPLPSERRMAELEREGYTAIVSLLHPAVVPFETKLIADGRAAAARTGLDYIHVPMLPWVSDNSEALDRIAELSREGDGRYYVHCYLGKDRVRLAGRIIEQAGLAASGAHGAPPSRLADGLVFERGEVIEIEPGLFLTPYPTDDEMMRYILPGPHAMVVSLLDPDNVDDAPWIEKEREVFENNGLTFRLMPLPEGDDVPHAALEVARQVVSLPRPLVVHAFLSPRTGRSPSAAAFLEAYRSIVARHPRVGPSSSPSPPEPTPAVPEPGWFRTLVPSTRHIILAAPILLLFTAAAASLAGWLRTVKDMKTPYTRKVFHFVIFTAAGLLHLAGGLPLVNLFGVIVSCAVLYAVMRGDGFPFYEAMARPADSPRRTMFILLPLATTAVGGFVSALMFGKLAYVGYLVTGWGDAVGEPVGAAFGRNRYSVPSLGGVPATRSLEGSSAVFMVGTLAAFVGLTLGGVAPVPAAGTALACAAVGTAVEAFSTHGLDNLTLQIAASGTAWLLLG